MKIAVLGGSGRIGMAVIQEALSLGHSVCTLVRHPEKLASFNSTIEIIAGDATNLDDCKKAIQDADIVIHAVSVPLRHTKPTSLYSRVTQTLIDARPTTQAKKLIVMSSMGTDHIRKSLPRPAHIVYEKLLGDVADDKEKEESLLSSSTLPWIIIKAPMLTNGKRGNYSSTIFEEYTHSLFDHISRKTVAKAIVKLGSSNVVHEKCVLIAK